MILLRIGQVNGDFRNNYDNIRAYQVGNLWRTQNNYSNAQFINGDSNWSGFNFCELNNVAGQGVCWEVKGNNGQVNQLVFNDINGISNDSGAGSNDVFLKITNGSRITMPSGGNAEQFATTTQIVSGNGIYLTYTKYVTQTNGATGKAFLDTSSTAYNVNVQCKEVELSAATIIWRDANTLAGQSNRLSGINGGNCVLTDNGGSALYATSTRSSIEGIYNNIDGSTGLANFKMWGDRLIMNFSGTINSYISYIGGAMRIVLGGTERFTFTDAGNLGLGSSTPSSTLTIVGSMFLSGIMRDSTGSAGSAGECLTSTGTAIDWASCGGGGGLSGGSTGLLALWNSASSLTTGLFADNGVVTGIGATSSSQRFMIASTTGNMMWAFGTNGVMTFASTTATSSNNMDIGDNGKIGIFNRQIAGQSILTTKIASSSEYGLQTALWGKRVVVWDSAGVAAGQQLGAVFTASSTGAVVTPTYQNNFQSETRNRWSTVVTTLNQQVGIRSAVLWHRTSTTTIGGFFGVIDVGFQTWTANNVFFAGFSPCVSGNCIAATTTIANMVNAVGFAVESGTTQLVFLTNDGSGVVSTSSISGMPTLASGQGYKMYIYSRGGDNVIYWAIYNQNTKQFLAEGNVTTNLPAVNTRMSVQTMCGNRTNTAANSCQMDTSRIYVESEQ